MKEVICTCCPQGCHLQVDEANDYKVTGNGCPNGIAYGKETVDAISEMVSWIAPITVYPGEDELLALAQGALRVLKGEEPALEYRRPRPDDNN